MAGHADTLQRAGGDVLPMHWDLRDAASVPQKLARIEQHFGPVDILVNNTGGPPPTSALGVPIADWEAHFHDMVSSVIGLTDLVVPGMRPAQVGPRHHEHVVRRGRADSQSGDIECAAPRAGRVVEDAVPRSGRGWCDRQHRPARTHRDTRRIEQLDVARAKREGRTVEDVMRASTESIPVGRYGKPQEYARYGHVPGQCGALTLPAPSFGSTADSSPASNSSQGK